MSRESMQTQHFWCRKVASVASHAAANKWDAWQFILQVSLLSYLQVIWIPISPGVSSLYLQLKNSQIFPSIKRMWGCSNNYCNKTSLTQTKGSLWLTTASMLWALKKSQIISESLFLIATNNLAFCEALLPCKCWKVWADRTILQLLPQREFITQEAKAPSTNAGTELPCKRQPGAFMAKLRIKCSLLPLGYIFKTICPKHGGND